MFKRTGTILTLNIASFIIIALIFTCAFIFINSNFTSYNDYDAAGDTHVTDHVLITRTTLRNINIGLIILGLASCVMSVAAAYYIAGALKKPFEEIESLKDSAEVSSRIKSEFLANMSHEIRTPMNSIVGFSELALDDNIPEKTRNYLISIQENSEWLLQIINDILDISKIESGKMELEYVPFNPRDLLNACRAVIMPKAIEKGLKLSFYTEPFIGRLPVGDPTKLRQIFINLLSNAIKFTDEGTVEFHTSVKNASSDSVVLYIEVNDTGIGMSQEQIKEIFNPFTQAESDTTRKYGGTGLGLSITKNLVDMMGSELNVVSSLGKGSKFSFELILKTVAVSEDERIEQQFMQSKINKPTFEGEVLVCEDNAMNRQVICEHLKRVGLKAVIAENGKIAVELVKIRMQRIENYDLKDESEISSDVPIKQFDLIFMDIHMPVMDGFEATIKINELGAGIPIIAMTASVILDESDLYEKSGMIGYLGKPFTSQELWHCLLRFFKPVGWNKESGQSASADKKLRQILIRKFLTNNINKYTEITEAINAGDISLAHRLVHTLKTNAALLDHNHLRQAAENVEINLNAAEDVNNVTMQQLQTLETELNLTIMDLTPMI